VIPILGIQSSIRALLEELEKNSTMDISSFGENHISQIPAMQMLLKPG